MGRWNAILGRLRETIEREDYAIWLSAMQFGRVTDDTLEIEVPNEYFKRWISEHFIEEIEQATQDILGAPRNVVIKLKPRAPRSAPVQRDLFIDPPHEERAIPSPPDHPELNAAPPSPPTPPPTLTPTPAPEPPTLDPPPAVPPSHEVPTPAPTPLTTAPPDDPIAPVFDTPSTSISTPPRPSPAPLKSPPVAITKPPSAITATAEAFGLKSDYTFDAFIVGPSNHLAHAASRAVAEQPAMQYNPLFIYGGVGLGKTHLMHAIGHAVLRRTNGQAKIIYRSSEQFMNELIRSIERKQMNAFREYYRTQCDVLLIDDIQLIAGKERTQEEFFHTFNTLHNSRRQIVLTSDKTPQEIPGLEERLQSRFSWGLIADIQRPEMETRIAILRKKVAQEQIVAPAEVLSLLAHHIDTNVRELEGSLRRVTAHAKLTGQPLTLELVHDVLGTILKTQSNHLTPDQVLQKVSHFFNVSITDIKGRGRARVVAYPRQVAMFLVRKHTELSYPDIGRIFGKDHTTIINAFQKIERALSEDATVRSDIEALERILIS